MQCPNCKYPNPTGVTHCGMCYEVFGRSAADTMMRTINREKYAASQSQENVSSVGRLFLRLQASGRRFSRFLGQHPLGVLGFIFVAGVAGGVFLLKTPGVRLALDGSRPRFQLDDGQKIQLLVSFQTHFKSWTELHGHFDTPVEDKQLEELGNLTLEQGPDQTIVARANEWTEQTQRAEGSFESRTLAPHHPSLAAAHLKLSDEGRVVSRTLGIHSRPEKALLFAIPNVPPGTLRKGATWTMPVKWVDQLGEFKLFWSGTLRWTLVERTDSEGSPCDRYVVRGSLQPVLWAAPMWCDGIKHMTYTNENEGEFLYDIRRHRLSASSFNSTTTLRIPLSDVEHVPDNLRVGREVHGAGRLMVEIASKMSLASPSTR